MKIDKLLYNFLKDKVGDYQLRYPFQDSPVDYKNGFVSWQMINSKILSTQIQKKEVARNVFYTSNNQKFESQYMLYCERENNKDNTQPFDLVSQLNIYFNSEAFISFCKQYYKDIEILRITDTITNDNYLSETKKWHTRATMILNFIENREVSLSDFEINQIQIDTQGV